MEVNDFSHALCELNTVIDKYLNSKKAMDMVRTSGRSICLPDESLNIIIDVLVEKIGSYEKQIIELATKLTQGKAE